MITSFPDSIPLDQYGPDPTSLALHESSLNPQTSHHLAHNSHILSVSPHQVATHSHILSNTQSCAPGGLMGYTSNINVTSTPSSSIVTNSIIQNTTNSPTLSHHQQVIKQ